MFQLNRIREEIKIHKARKRELILYFPRGFGSPSAWFMVMRCVNDSWLVPGYELVMTQQRDLWEWQECSPWPGESSAQVGWRILRDAFGWARTHPALAEGDGWMPAAKQALPEPLAEDRAPTGVTLSGYLGSSWTKPQLSLGLVLPGTQEFLLALPGCHHVTPPSYLLRLTPSLTPG